MPGCLDAEGLEWIGGGDGGDGIMWRGDWKKFSHAQASGPRRILGAPHPHCTYLTSSVAFVLQRAQRQTFTSP